MPFGRVVAPVVLRFWRASKRPGRHPVDDTLSQRALDLRDEVSSWCFRPAPRSQSFPQGLWTEGSSPVEHAAMPVELDDAEKRDRYRPAMWKVLSSRTVEKIALVTLITIVFGAILPNAQATPTQILLGSTVFVVLNSMLGMSLSKRSWSIQLGVLQFVVVVAANLAIVQVFDVMSSRFEARDATFFVLLLSLVVCLYDRYRPIYEVRVFNGDFDHIPRPGALPKIAVDPV